MTLAPSSAAVLLSPWDITTEALSPAVPTVRAEAAVPAAAVQGQAPVRDVVEEWGLASFPASDPPSNW